MSNTVRELNHWFTAQVQPHEPMLRSYLKGKLSDPEDVDDVVQHSYARLFKLHEQKGVDNPKAFLFHAARGAVCDFYRRQRIVRFESLTEANHARTRDHAPTADAAASRRDEIELLRAAIDNLPERCSAVVSLRIAKGLAFKEIARELGISVNTVKAQLAKGMRLIAGHLAHLDNGLADQKGAQAG